MFHGFYRRPLVIEQRDIPLVLQDTVICQVGFKGIPSAYVFPYLFSCPHRDYQVTPLHPVQPQVLRRISCPQPSPFPVRKLRIRDYQILTAPFLQFFFSILYSDLRIDDDMLAS